MIDFGAVQKEAGFLKKVLRQVGLPLSINEAIAALARTIRDHKHFERILTEIGPAERQDLYDSVIPHLRFTPKPLDVYVAGAGQMAEREQLPTLDEKGNLRAFRPAADVDSVEKHAQELLLQSMAKRRLTVICHRCLAEENLYQIGDETRVGVVIRLRKMGWVYDPQRETETCPECAVNG